MQDPLEVVVFSFGFKYGFPLDVNLLLDVRFLPNPYWVEELRPKTGLVEDVAGYILTSDAGSSLISHLESNVKFLVEQNQKAQKKVMRIAVGCTGGRHRSVAVTEKIGEIIEESGMKVNLYHRDIERDGVA